ncbi:hypothetical protein OROMI_020718 [Orobanche minor]
MQGSGDSSMVARTAEWRLACERKMAIQQQRIDSLLTFSRNRFDSAVSEAQRTIQLQEKLGKLSEELREAEDALVKALSVCNEVEKIYLLQKSDFGLQQITVSTLKNRKEAKRMALMESISDMKPRVEELKGLVEDQRKRKDEYAAIISQQLESLTAYKEKCAQNREHREQIEEAISWYNKVLAFRIECGHGVKFVFTNISRENPNEEYFFIIRHENDIYTLLNCEPRLSDINDMVNELNNTNGLFKFVRTMREKFQEAAARGISVHCSSLDQDSSIISLSAPISSISTDHSFESPRTEKGLQSDTSSRKVGKGHLLNSPQSSPLRRSARLKGKHR